MIVKLDILLYLVFLHMIAHDNFLKECCSLAPPDLQLCHSALGRWGRAPPRSGKDRGLPAVPGVGVAKNVLLAGPFWAFKAASVKNKTG